MDPGATAYILGAGANQVIKAPYEDVSPPLIRDFFQVACQLDYWPGAGPTTKGERFRPKYQGIYDYVERHWNKDFDTLLSGPFDLEQLYTRLQSEAAEAERRGQSSLQQELGRTFMELTTYLAEILQVFWGGTGFDAFSRLAQIIWEEQASVITFNYDTYLEDAITLSAGKDMPSEETYNDWHRRFDARSGDPSLGVADEDLALRDFHWDRNLAYGLEFDTVQMQRFGTAPIVDGVRFYPQPDNELYVNRQFLKLHGSLNWFTYAPLPGLPPEEADHTVVLDWRYYKDPYWGIDLPRHPNGRLLQPAIVTPVLHKDAYFGAPMYRRLFPPVWKRAHKVLSECTRLLVIGYSLSASDVRTKNLLREAFDKHDLQELVVVNPNTEIAEKAKELCFAKSVTCCEDLEEFLEMRIRANSGLRPLPEWNRASSELRTLAELLVHDDPVSPGQLVSVRGELNDSFVPPANAKLPRVGEYVVLSMSGRPMERPTKRVLGWFQVSSVETPEPDSVILTVVAAFPPLEKSQEALIFSPERPDQVS